MNNSPIAIILDQSRRTTPLPKSYSHLITTVKALYKDSLAYPFKIYYYDLERDLISVTTQDDYSLACAGIPASKLEFIVLRDSRPSKNLVRRFPCSFTERTRGSFVDKASLAFKGRTIDEVPLEESKILVDSSMEGSSKAETGRSSKNVQGEGAAKCMSQINSCCTQELSNIKGGMSKLLEEQIKEIVKREVSSAMKKEIKKLTVSQQCNTQTPRYNSNKDGIEGAFCDKCLLL
eukprot:TRINITY_DN10546_c0_g1_i5.p1 TRINITY_DN10546_c0_g1~~TRINITY_DN10546_c0_g1_i5.p1  ORF type:complete len:234 (-),score=43.76 TRINITY_DN10546_c0_g1_i5:94-795(-)